ncbi:hypothetical protein [Rhodohalobacter mucosus]|uniref:Carbohydrate-binding domain-containing protein n=1 Tax=Rhodohalobacter mucosus TaxID=2079485 RepID=A0A316TR92_9BACT|nr:hypothetical protein [Rhodohalobacter mucosus]PWN06211.1 hypothetical protein DDZ15_10275 [Rhodohalobacter mucosus]
MIRRKFNFNVFALFFLLSASLIFFAACGSTSTITPPETSDTPVIDGSLSDWDTGETLIMPEEGINYYARYDEQNLYLFIEITSPFRDRTIRQSGLIVYLSDNEEERNKTGVGYPSGSFNLLRENPAVFNDFLTESDWFSKPANLDMLENLEEQIFDRILIVERPDGRNPEYAFVDQTRIEVDGMQIAADNRSRYISLELKIPRNGDSIYGFNGNDVWLGLAVETPSFRINTDSDYSPTMDRQRGIYGNQRQRQPRRQDISRSLGEFEKWVRLDLR